MQSWRASVPWGPSALAVLDLLTDREGTRPVLTRWALFVTVITVIAPYATPMTAHRSGRQGFRFPPQYGNGFPRAFDANKPRSSAVMMLAVYDLGYKGRTTNHSFRHTMSTLLHEQGFNSAWIEMQLAHVDKNSIRGTYNHAQYLEGRTEMMPWYADYIDSLADQGL